MIGKFSPGALALLLELVGLVLGDGADLEEFQRFLAQTKRSCAEADVDYELVRTDEPLDAVLLRFLSRRQGKRR